MSRVVEENRQGRPRRLDNVVWKDISGKGILLDLRDGVYFEVGAVGLEIWKRCDGKSNVGQIAGVISRQFEADPEEVSRDVEQFVRRLERRRMVEWI